MRLPLTLVAATLALGLAATAAQAQDPLPSWNEGAAKKSIVASVDRVTKEGLPDFVPGK